MRDSLAHRVRASPDRLAVVDATSGDRLTYRELDEAATRSAGRLAATGVGAGDRLGLLVDTSLEAVTLVHGALRLGATLVPLNVRLARPELERQADRAGIDALVSEADTTADAEAVTDVTVVALDGSASVPSLPETDRAPFEPARWEPDDVQVVLFTSGTTGAPKAVPLAAENLLASAVASAFRLGALPDDRWLLPLSIYHMGGLAPVLRCAVYGSTLVVLAGFDADGVIEATHERSITGVSLVPTMFARVLDAGGDLAESLRFVLLGGAPADPDLLSRARERDVPVYPTYGMTETASQVATATPAESREHPGTVGFPLLGTDVAIVDEDGRPVPAGTRGEIVVSGPTVAPGYDDDPAETGWAFGPLGFHTGDLGRVDGDGRLWVDGRLDDRIVTGGENVHPAEVEDALRSHPAVRDAAVVGLPDPEWGQRVGALVVADDDAVAAEALRSHCRERLAGFKCPRTVRFADELPRTTSGTVEREAVVDRLREGKRGN